MVDTDLDGMPMDMNVDNHSDDLLSTFPHIEHNHFRYQWQDDKDDCKDDFDILILDYIIVHSRIFELMNMEMFLTYAHRNMKLSLELGMVDMAMIFV